MSSQDLLPSLILPSPLDPTARRVEIDEFIADDVLANLFLLSLREMQLSEFRSADDPKEDWFSFYNLATIHGFPFEFWRDVKNKEPQKVRNGYYCTHGSTVFPTWHRLYIHMFEQAVFRRMTQKAGEFDEPYRTANIAALKRFRFPYWDPCLPRVAIKQGDDVKTMFDMPEILKVTNVFIVLPDGTETQIRNPLRNFDFPSADQYQKTGRQVIDWHNKEGLSSSIAAIKENGYSVTIRTPSSNGQQDDEQFTGYMQEEYYSLSTNFFSLLHPDRNGGKDPWDKFANHFIDKVSGPRWPENTSLESWHDNIHGLVGSGDKANGHMTVVPVAAFDPIFWLHHNNIDRMFALYQALYEHKPGHFVSNEIKKPNRVGAKSELSPFVKVQTATEQTCYTSEDVEDWTGLGFAIPGDRKLDEEGRKKVAQYLMDVYEWSSERTRPKDSLGYPKPVKEYYVLSGKDFDIDTKKEMQFLALENDQIMAQTFSTAGDKISESVIDTSFELPVENRERFPMGTFLDRGAAKMRTWSMLMRVKKYAFRQSFNVEIFIGKGTVPSAAEGAQYFMSPNEAGFSSIFAFDPDSECDNCADNRDMIYGDVITITPKLREYLSNNVDPSPWPPANLRILPSLDTEHVVPFLKEHLEWRIVLPDGRVASRDEVKAAELELLLADSVYQYPIAGNDVGPLGSYGEWTHHPDATRGRIGGYPEGL